MQYGLVIEVQSRADNKSHKTTIRYGWKNKKGECHLDTMEGIAAEFYSTLSQIDSFYKAKIWIKQTLPDKPILNQDTIEKELQNV